MRNIIDGRDAIIAIVAGNIFVADIHFAAAPGEHASGFIHERIHAIAINFLGECARHRNQQHQRRCQRDQPLQTLSFALPLFNEFAVFEFAHGARTAAFQPLRNFAEQFAEA